MDAPSTVRVPCMDRSISPVSCSDCARHQVAFAKGVVPEACHGPACPKFRADLAAKGLSGPIAQALLFDELKCREKCSKGNWPWPEYKGSKIPRNVIHQMRQEGFLQPLNGRGNE